MWSWCSLVRLGGRRGWGPEERGNRLELVHPKCTPFVPRLRTRPDQLTLDVRSLRLVDRGGNEVAVHEYEGHRIPFVGELDPSHPLTRAPTGQDAAGLDLDPMAVWSDGVVARLPSLASASCQPRRPSTRGNGVRISRGLADFTVK